jgi:hypothetical protein
VRTDVLLAASVGSLIVTVATATLWSTRTQSAQIEALAQEVRRDRASLARLEASLAAKGRGAQPASLNANACPPGTEVGAAGLEAAIMNAVNQALDERETSEALEREVEAQPSPAAEAAAEKAESLIDEAVQMRVWSDVTASRFRELSQSMTTDQVRDLRRRVAVLSNEGKIVFEGDLPPF